MVDLKALHDLPVAAGHEVAQVAAVQYVEHAFFAFTQHEVGSRKQKRTA